MLSVAFVHDVIKTYRSITVVTLTREKYLGSINKTIETTYLEMGYHRW